MDKLVSGVPYRWGGYFKELTTFTTRQEAGDLTGSICTCRSKSLNYCVMSDPEPVGLDCSGL